MRVLFRPQARAEALEAQARAEALEAQVWYESRAAGLGLSLLGPWMLP